MAEQIVAEVEYREIPNYPGYRVGNDGTVWSQKNSRGRIIGVWKQLKPRWAKDHLAVNLSHDGKAKNFYIHTLVLEAFRGPRPEGLVGCHDDGSVFNNRIGNLRWDTWSGNHLDKRAHGTANAGSRHPMAKLTERDVVGIRKLCRASMAVKEIAHLFGVSRRLIRFIRSRQIWAHVA